MHLMLLVGLWFSWVMGTARADDPAKDPGPLGGWAWRVTDRLDIRYHRVDDLLPGFEDRRIHDYVEQVNRFNLLLSKGGLGIGLQVDEVGLFANRYILDGKLYHSYPLYTDDIASPFPDGFVNLEKAYLRYVGRWGEATLGDAYVSFGRGMALNLIRNTNIDIDSSLRGVKALVRAGPFDMNLVTGLTNPQQVQLDNRNLLIHPDARSMISGLRAEAAGLGSVSLGLHGVLYRFDRDVGDGDLGLGRYGEPLDAIATGATLEAMNLLGADLFLEGAWVDYHSSDFFNGEEPRPGRGLYASATFFPGPLVIVAETKFYKDLERLNTWSGLDGYEVAVAPSLEYERVINEDSAAAVNSNDISGARLRADLSLSGGSFVPFLSLAAFRDQEVGGLHFNLLPETILHPVAGVQFIGEHTKVVADLGVRADFRDSVTGMGLGPDRDVQLHGDLDVEVPAGPLGSVELAIVGERYHWGDNLQQQDDYLEFENSLSVHPADRWTLILYQDYSDNPLLRTEGNLSEKVYGAVELMFKPTSATSLRLFYGAYKAGIRCAGGQCRNLPGFEGARLSLAGSF